MKKIPLALAVSSIAVSQFGLAQIEEVIVTAQKREQSLQDVPLAISAFEGNFIKEAKVDNFKDVIKYTPGLSGFSQDSFVDSITVRGINTNDFGIGIDPAIGIYVDGVYQGRTGGAINTLFDVARMEVVKGPQGTLFGRNSTAGAISIYRNKPEEEFGGYVSAGLARFGYEELEAVINTPLSDTVLSRLAVHYEDTDGFTSNVQGGENLGFSSTKAARLSLAYTGWESVEATVGFDYEKRQGTSSQYRAEDKSFAVGGGDVLFDRLGGGRRDVDSDLRGADNFDLNELWGISVEIEGDLTEELSFTSITAVRGHHYGYQEDFDGTPFVIDTFSLDQEQDYYSQEFRVNYDGSNGVYGFVGASAYQESVHARLSDTVDQGLAFEEEADGVIITEPYEAKGDYDGFAVYGDVSWTLSEQWELTAGARYTVDNRDFSLKYAQPYDSYGELYDPTFNFGYYTSRFIDGQDDWSDFTPRVALNYLLNEDVTVFASYSTGYKSGGFDTGGMVLPNNFVPYCGSYSVDEGEGPDDEGCPENVDYELDVADIAQLKSVEPETSENFELGIKSNWWENRFQVNASVYYYLYENRQVSYTQGRVTLLGNVGESDGRGFEMDMRLVPDDHWDVRLGLAYTDTKITDIVDGVCNQNCVGNELTGTPKWSGSLIVSYLTEVGEGELKTSWESVAESKSYEDFDNQFSRAGWNESNLRLRYTPASEVWEVNAYIENIFDQFHYDRYIDNDGGEFVPNTHSGPSKPRTLGVGFTYNY